VDQSSRDLFSRKIGYYDLDILSLSGDIRNQSPTLQKIDRNFACFWLPNFLGERHPNFWNFLLLLSQIPIMWQSLMAIGRGTSEMWLPKKHHG